ncbi:MAG TPA: GNAT family N-acetyltransferase [Alphaproteobacteria bacterium]|nr:GNAT family N-acetyltransferase [Alphaproteobacteria bacterium]
MSDITMREDVRPNDRQKVFTLLNSSGYFLPREMAYGMGLFDEHLMHGEKSNYRFLLLERDGMLLGYGCYGPVRCSDRRYHLHWMTIDRNIQHQGLGRMLADAIADKVRGLGGVKIFGTVSNRTYRETQAFYSSCGYKLVAELPDYYGDGDAMVYCVKDLIS